MTAPPLPASVLHSSVDDMEVTADLVRDPHHGLSVTVGLRNTVGDHFPGSGPVQCDALLSVDDYERLCRRGLALVALARDLVA